MTLKDLMKLSLDLILILSVMLDHLLLSPEQTICCIYQHGNIVPSHPPHTHFISQPFIFMFISHHGYIFKDVYFADYNTSHFWFSKDLILGVKDY